MNTPQGPSFQSEMYSELRQLAESWMRRERIDHSLQATALVHEAWLRLASQKKSPQMEERDFLAAAATMMRRILIDHARARATEKRGGHAIRLTLDELGSDDVRATDVDILELDDALSQLEALNPRHAKVVELRFFSGMSIEETAKALGVSDFTVKADWRVARAWLLSELQQD